MTRPSISTSGGDSVLSAVEQQKERTLARGKAHVWKLYTELFGGTSKSSIEDRASSDKYYPKFKKHEMQLGKVLGKGGFGTVYEIRSFYIKGTRVQAVKPRAFQHSEEEDLDLDQALDDIIHSTHHNDNNNNSEEDAKMFQSKSRWFLAQHCLRAKQKKRRSILQSLQYSQADARYAVKILSDSIVAGSDLNLFLQGMMDMAIETRFLCTLKHPNIVKIRGLSQCDPFSTKEQYFLVMDRLYDTLEKRIYQTWKPRRKLYKSAVTAVVPQKRAKLLHALWEERLVYAYDLSSALTYLHQHQIIYRLVCSPLIICVPHYACLFGNNIMIQDLKPENVGFDCRDDIKLFDFGLCRELRESDRIKIQQQQQPPTLTTKESDESLTGKLNYNNDDNNDQTHVLYRLTAETGSPRYMAPEVALGKPYNSTCDTYSFCILLWQMLALKTPFEVYTMTKMKTRVWGAEQKRPQLEEDWSAPIKLLLQKGWSPILEERYTMGQVESMLRDECLRIGAEADDLEHERRRSSFVMSEPGSDDNSIRRQKQNAVSAIHAWYEQEDFSETVHAAAEPLPSEAFIPPHDELDVVRVPAILPPTASNAWRVNNNACSEPLVQEQEQPTTRESVKENVPAQATVGRAILEDTWHDENAHDNEKQQNGGDIWKDEGSDKKNTIDDSASSVIESNGDDLNLNTQLPAVQAAGGVGEACNLCPEVDKVCEHYFM
ncbi:Probable LIM domain-containing serine/threonine-protein kinase DDB [Seminavis robusta]|uniref:Probable LIM domain-containing serine/threonine-protein kinase DDB n=1 Tax=Seminavis robusta TaxID=568900 RepID=A0A9N8E926_9STRA|nr:Probable LIM domain-containing serine/threonine-protein kinase DDB [Seminavis robusta]|eukprot:Sro808_g205360.1 Probable LIM domain-containing serine/threonine-protein kinase DDB (716) ;mRNA; f:7686-10105